MKFFTNKESSKKIITAILIIMLFNFISPTVCNAELDEFGGKLFKPIAQLLRGLADLTIQGLQLFFTGNKDISREEVNNLEEIANRFRKSIRKILYNVFTRIDIFK